MKRAKNIAVVGTGYWGKNLVRNFSELNALSALCDIHKDRLAMFRQEYGVDKTYAIYADLLKDPDIDAVAIATPAVLHYAMVKDALLAGKDVFVEKPLALHVEEAEELTALAESLGRILMVDHILQYHPAVLKLHELIQDGELGNLQYMYSNRLNIGQLRKEENILWSFAPHDISVILKLVGQKPLSVSAFGEAYLQEGIYDTTNTFIEFGERLKAHIFVSWLHPYKEQKLVCIGDKNMAVFNDMEPENKLILYPHKVEWIKKNPVAAKAEAQIVPLEKKEPLKESCRHFLSCIQLRITPRTDGREATEVLSVLSSAQQALDHNGVLSAQRLQLEV